MEDEKFDGLYLHGIVTNRLKKDYGENKVLLTYVIKADERDYYVKDWNSSNDLMLNKGEHVSIKVYLKVFNEKIEYYIKRDDYAYLGEEI